VLNYWSYPKNKTGYPFFGPPCIECVNTSFTTLVLNIKCYGVCLWDLFENVYVFFADSYSCRLIFIYLFPERIKFNISYLRMLLNMLNLIPLFCQTHNYRKTPSQHWCRKRRKTPPRHLDIIAQTHTDLIDLHLRVRDQSQPPIQYWFCNQQDYGNSPPPTGQEFGGGHMFRCYGPGCRKLFKTIFSCEHLFMIDVFSFWF